MNTYLIAYRFTNADDLLGPKAVQWATIEAEDGADAGHTFKNDLCEIYSLEFVDEHLRILTTQPA